MNGANEKGFRRVARLVGSYGAVAATPMLRFPAAISLASVDSARAESSKPFVLHRAGSVLLPERLERGSDKGHPEARDAFSGRRCRVSELAAGSLASRRLVNTMRPTQAPCRGVPGRRSVRFRTLKLTSGTSPSARRRRAGSNSTLEAQGSRDFQFKPRTINPISLPRGSRRPNLAPGKR